MVRLYGRTTGALRTVTVTENSNSPPRTSPNTATKYPLQPKNTVTALTHRAFFV